MNDEIISALQSAARTKYARPRIRLTHGDTATDVDALEFAVEALIQSLAQVSELEEDRDQWKAYAKERAKEHNTLLSSVHANEGLVIRDDVEMMVQEALQGIQNVSNSVTVLERLLAHVKLRHVEVENKPK